MADVITPYTKEQLQGQGWVYEEAYTPDPPIRDERIFEITLPIKSGRYSIPRDLSGALKDAVVSKKLIVVKPDFDNGYPNGHAAFSAYATYEDYIDAIFISLYSVVSSDSTLDITINHPNRSEITEASVTVTEYVDTNLDTRIYVCDLTQGMGAERYAELEAAASDPNKIIFVKFRTNYSPVATTVELGVGWIVLYGIFSYIGVGRIYIRKDSFEVTFSDVYQHQTVEIALSRTNPAITFYETQKLLEAAKKSYAITVFDTKSKTAMPAAYTVGVLNPDNDLPSYVVVSVYAPQVILQGQVRDRMYRVYVQNHGSDFPISIREFRSPIYDEIT